MGVHSLLVISLCLFITISAEEKAHCVYNGNVINHGDSVIIDCSICECFNGEITDCQEKSDCTSKSLNAKKVSVSTNFEDDPNVFESSEGKRIKRGANMLSPGNLKKMFDSKSKDSGSNIEVKGSVMNGYSEVKSSGIVGIGELKSSVSASGKGSKGSESGEVKNQIISGNAEVKGFGIGGSVSASEKGRNGGDSGELKIGGNAEVKSFGIGGTAELKGSLSGHGKGSKGGHSGEVKGPLVSGSAEVKSFGIGGSSELKGSLSGRGKGSKGGNSGEVKGPLVSGSAEVKSFGIGGIAELKGSLSGHGKDIKVEGVQVGASADRREDNKVGFDAKFGLKKASGKGNDNAKEDNSKEHVGFGGKFKLKKTSGEDKEDSKQDNSEEHIRFDGKFKLKKTSSEDKDDSKQDNSKEHIGFGGKLKVKKTSGKVKDNSKQDNSEEHIGFGGKFKLKKTSGEAKDNSKQDSSEEHGQNKSRGKSGNKSAKGNGSKESSEEAKGQPKSGKKNKYGSSEEHGRLNIHIKGRKESSSKEDHSKEKKGHGHSSHEKGRKDKENSKESNESLEKDHSKEKNQDFGKSSFEDIDLDSGIVPTNNPEFTIEPIIIPQTAQLLYQDNSVTTEEVETVEPTEPVEPQEPLQPTEVVEPVEPTAVVEPVPITLPAVEPTEPVEPQEPLQPTEVVVPVEPTAVVEPVPTTLPAQNPSEGESCTFNKDIVADGQTTELDCVSCECDDGSLTCMKNLSCPGICSVAAYQMIRTFDGTLYETPGTCSYVLVKTRDFSISLSNKLCSELRNDIQDPDAVCIEYVDVYIPSKANIRLQADGSILVSGETSSLPYSVLDTITVLRSSSVFLDVVSQELKIQYDFAGNRLYVILDASYKGTTNGLCGTYNDNRNDDYRSSSDMTETVSGLFSKSWKTQFQCSESEKSQEDRDRKVQADLTCSDALDSSLFEDCALLLDTHTYKISCSQSVYYGGSIGLCSAMADFAYRCARAGISVSVSSTFTDCTPVCEGDMIFTTDDTFSQQDCAEYSVKLQKITTSIPLNEACICPPDLYYDASIDKCVNGDSCPCYVKNHVYQIGEIITQPNGQTCPCERILQCGEPEEPPTPDVEKCADNEIYSDCMVGYGKSCELSCQNLAMQDQICTLDCVPGCVCKTGLLRSSDGSCVPLNQCPCVHGDDVYNPGETLARDCNTCTCENGKFVCTNNPCTKVCNTYAGSQFFLFDGVWKSFETKHCAIVLVESLEGSSPSFSVVMQNAPNEELGGALLRKIITIKFGGTTVVLSNSDPVVLHELGARTEFRTYRSGFYVVVHFLEGLAVYYDQHLDVIIQLEPQLQGKVQGMCGDADGTTLSELEIGNMAQYASRFLVDECPDDDDPLPPPSEKHKKFVENRCSILKNDDFAECHNVVNVEPYYMACVEETEACREGESCLCYCTSLAAYARACCRKGITIDWRTPDTCPSPCEYYNRDAGEGPYRLLMINGKSLVADYDTSAVSVDDVDTSGNLKASFMVTRGLFVDPLNGRKLISLESAQHQNFFIVQNEDGTLSLKKWQPDVDFRSQATFVLRASRWVKGFEALESYVSRGHYLSLNSNGLVMTPVKSGNMLQMSFKLVEETFGLPSFSICTWKYRACSNPCIPTCQDPLGTKCTLTLKIEGCYPLCAPGMVFDEVTHRCVQIEDCITITVPTVTNPTQAPETTQTPPTPPHETPSPEITTPLISSTTETEPCKNVLCPPPEKCTKTGAELVEIAWGDRCCPLYKCVCKDACAPLPTCYNDKPPVRIGDPDTTCCPEYICEPEPTPSSITTPDQCKGATCIITDCSSTEILVEVPSNDSCCAAYECVPETTLTPSPTPPCSNVKCAEPDCLEGERIITQINPNDPCCAQYICETKTTPAPISTTVPSICSGKVCPPEPECIMQGSRKVYNAGDDPCCPEVDCECDPCSPPPDCGPDSKLSKSIDPETECCFTYNCSGTNRPPPTTPPCEHVVCETPACKKGAKIVVSPWQEDCCPHMECQCEQCLPIPDCQYGAPLLTEDPRTVCCPEFICPPPPEPSTEPPSKDPCADHACVTVDCAVDEIKVEIPGTDPCCKSYICIPPIPPSPTPPTVGPQTCDYSKCPAKPTCEDGENLLVKNDPDNECCSLYECIPSVSPTPEIPLQSTPEKCKDVSCVVPECSKEDSKPVPVGSDGNCCFNYECVCDACQPVPYCNGYQPRMYFNPDTQCCPKYDCPIPTLPPVEPSTPAVVTTPPPPPPPCLNVVCEPTICTKTGEVPVLVEVASETRCCSLIRCECEKVCSPPTCDDGRPALLLGNLDTECCPKYECPTPPPVLTTPSSGCSHVHCSLEPECGDFEVKVEIPSANECCKEYICVLILQPTTPPPVPPCHGHICQERPDCENDGNLLEKDNPSDPCCPLYECLAIPTPSNPTFTTTQPEYCQGVTCTVPLCTVNGEKLVQVSSEQQCCPEYACVCSPCSPAPDCGEGSVGARYNPEEDCCPSYFCLPPTTISPPVTSQPPAPITTLPPPPPPCVNVVCEPATCTKTGEVPVVVEVSSDTRCCPIIRCECEKVCSPPTCEDGSPALLLGNLDTECCPEYECQSPTPVSTTPPSGCSHVHCSAEPVCKEEEVKVEIQSDNECCKEYTCVPIPQPPTSPPPVPPCEGHICQARPDCKHDETLLEKDNPSDPCCPLYECLPPIPPPTTRMPTTHPDYCWGVTCTVPLCTVNGEKLVQVPSEQECCPEYTCVCSPCPPAPGCGEGSVGVHYNPEENCCPSYFCVPPPTLSTTPVPATQPAETTRPLPPPPCLNVLCPPVSCKKTGEIPVVVELPSPPRCCPVIDCECEQTCQIPTCKGDKPPLLLGNPDTECCPQYECPPTPTPPPTECEHVSCAPEPTCGENENKVEVPTDDICCNAIFCIPGPIPTTPSTSPTPCDGSGCPPADCKEDEKVIEVSSKEDPCCPSYICIPPPTPTPSVVSTSPSDICQGVTCTVPECQRNGERPVPVNTNDPCCPAYKCECDPCPSAPDCGDEQPIVGFNLASECCPIYECPPPPPPPPSTTLKPIPPSTTTIISSTTNICKDRVCPIKQCKDYEHLVTSINPADPCCPSQTCECTCKTIPSCSSDERLVAVHQYNQCCPKLKCERKKDECHPVNTAVTLESGGCSANVILASCSGYCHSKTEYSSLLAPVSQCRCCAVTSTSPKNFQLPCPDGTKALVTVQEASQCGCQHCSEDLESGDGSGSGSGSGDDGSGFTLWSNFQETN